MAVGRTRLNASAHENVVTARTAAAVSRVRAQRFSLMLTLVLLAVVVRGFWPTYFGPLLTGRSVARPWVMHLHGAIFSGWMLLLLGQVSLAVSGRVRLHRRVGAFGIAYGCLVLIVGVVVSFAAPVRHVRLGEWTVDQAAAFLLLPLVDMILFAGFFGAAIAYRRRPEIHKRLIVAATLALAFAAVGRIFESSLVGFFVVWLTPLAAAIGFDLYSSRRVHPVYIVSAAVFVVAFLRLLVMESPFWLTIGSRLLAPLL